MRMRRIVICGLFGAKIFLHIISQTARFSDKKVVEHKKCVFWFSVRSLAETLLFLRRTDGNMVKNVYWSSVKYPLFLSYFNETWIFPDRFKKKKQKYQISWKSVQWELSCLHGDRRTDMTNLTVAFRNFWERALKKKTFSWCLGIALPTYPFTSVSFFLYTPVSIRELCLAVWSSCV